MVPQCSRLMSNRRWKEEAVLRVEEKEEARVQTLRLRCHGQCKTKLLRLLRQSDLGYDWMEMVIAE